MVKDITVSILGSRDDCASFPVGKPFKFSYDLLAHYGCLDVLGKTFTLELDSDSCVSATGECECAFSGRRLACAMFPCIGPRRPNKDSVRVVEIRESDGE